MKQTRLLFSSSCFRTPKAMQENVDSQLCSRGIHIGQTTPRARAARQPRARCGILQTPRPASPMQQRGSGPAIRFASVKTSSSIPLALSNRFQHTSAELFRCYWQLGYETNDIWTIDSDHPDIVLDITHCWGHVARKEDFYVIYNHGSYPTPEWSSYRPDHAYRQLVRCYSRYL
jgi:hypothetical protein